VAHYKIRRGVTIGVTRRCARLKDEARAPAPRGRAAGARAKGRRPKVALGAARRRTRARVGSRRLARDVATLRADCSCSRSQRARRLAQSQPVGQRVVRCASCYETRARDVLRRSRARRGARRASVMPIQAPARGRRRQLVHDPLRHASGARRGPRPRVPSAGRCTAACVRTRGRPLFSVANAVLDAHRTRAQRLAQEAKNARRGLQGRTPRARVRGRRRRACVMK
jgi:hypothetical protein